MQIDWRAHALRDDADKLVALPCCGLSLLRAARSRRGSSSEMPFDRATGKRCPDASRANVDAWRQVLNSRRALQIGRLPAYRERGKFPSYEAAQRVRRPVHRVLASQEPVFVDDLGVDCAVASLMRSDGLRAVDCTLRTYHRRSGDDSTTLPGAARNSRTDIEAEEASRTSDAARAVSKC